MSCHVMSCHVPIPGDGDERSGGGPSLCAPLFWPSCCGVMLTCVLIGLSVGVEEVLDLEDVTDAELESLDYTTHPIWALLQHN